MLPPLNNAFCQHPGTAGTMGLAAGSASHRQHPCHPGPRFFPHAGSWRRGRSLPPPPPIYFTAQRTQQIRERIRYGSLGLHILLPETQPRNDAFPSHYLSQHETLNRHRLGITGGGTLLNILTEPPWSCCHGNTFIASRGVWGARRLRKTTQRNARSDVPTPVLKM